MPYRGWQDNVKISVESLPFLFRETVYRRRKVDARGIGESRRCTCVLGASQIGLNGEPLDESFGIAVSTPPVCSLIVTL